MKKNKDKIEIKKFKDARKALKKDIYELIVLTVEKQTALDYIEKIISESGK